MAACGERTWEVPCYGRFGFLIYYMNQCDASMADHNVKNLTAHLELRANYASYKTDFQLIIDALPTEATK